MNKRMVSLTKLLVLLILVVSFGWLALSGMEIGRYNVLPITEAISQGLDLRGGVYAVYEAVDTDIEDFVSESFSGEGKVVINIPNTNLVNGSYFLDVAVHKWDGYPFDYHHFLYTFKITSKYKDFGITRLKTKWNFSDNIKLNKKK